MHRLAATLAAVLASAGLAAAQTATGPIGADPIGSDPIGAAPIGSATPSAGGGAPASTTRGVAGVGPVGGPKASDTGARIESSMRPPPSRVRGYVSRQKGPSVTLTRPLVVGQPLPDSVGLRAVPNSGYGYALVDGRRVIVEPETRRVIEVVD